MSVQVTDARADHARLQHDAREHLLLHLARNGAHDDPHNELLILDRAEGVRVYDTAGREYIDALSCLFCAQIGYSYGDEMADAAAEQLRRMPFNTNWNTAHRAAVDLADKLAELAPPDLDHVFFTGGGSESVETAWKLARQYHVANGQPQRRKAIARRTAYHGLSLGALALTGISALKEPFGEPAFETVHVSNTNRFRAVDGHDDEVFCQRLLAELDAAIVEAGPDTVALIAAEPIQNAGGCFTPPEGYWAGLREIADRYGILVLADEVISGFGRVGEYFACDRYGARPDLITVAKGLTSAYAPMGAVLVGERINEPLHRPGAVLSHGITFGGHPLSAAIALRNLDIFERDRVLENVRTLEPHLGRRLNDLRELPAVGDVRGDGFFWAIELIDSNGEPLNANAREDLVRGYLPRRMRELGLIARADDRGEALVQIAPPLVCDRETLDTIVDRLGELLDGAGDRLREVA
jgi:adenosylmethionine-8-amino-7-oxononanoate aminotransferase